MKRKELTRAFMMILNKKNLYKNISALQANNDPRYLIWLLVVIELKNPLTACPIKSPRI